jgi:hypothetical protein
MKPGDFADGVTRRCQAMQSGKRTSRSPTDHSLAIEQGMGISPHRVHELYSVMVHDSSP